MCDLLVIVDPNYGEQLEAVSDDAPAWIVDTPLNRCACESLWKRRPRLDHRDKGAVTCFKTADPEDRMRSLLGIIPQLETHHGEMQEYELIFPKGFVLEGIGIALCDEVADELREFGFTSFFETLTGFQARK